MTQNLARNGRYIMSGECAASGFSYRMEYEKFHNHRKKAILGHTPMGDTGGLMSLWGLSCGLPRKRQVL